MESGEAILLGMDGRELVAVCAMLVMFVFAVWFGATRCNAGIDEAEQARRTGSTPNV